MRAIKITSMLVLSLAASALLKSEALAAWDFESSNDPMTDEQVGFASIDNDDGTLGLAIKCWNDTDATQWIAIITQVDFGDASQYPESQDVTFRADKATPMTVKFSQYNISNKLSYVTSSELDGSYGELAKALSQAQTTLAINFMDNLSLFDVSNSSDVYGNMRSVCPRFAE